MVLADFSCPASPQQAAYSALCKKRACSEILRHALPDYLCVSLKRQIIAGVRRGNFGLLKWRRCCRRAVATGSSFNAPGFQVGEIIHTSVLLPFAPLQIEGNFQLVAQLISV